MFCGRHLCGDLSSLCVRDVVRVRAADSLPGIKRYRYSLLCCAWYKEAAMGGIAPRYRAPGLAAALSQIGFATWLRICLARKPA